MMDEIIKALKPCPFCGGEAKIVNRGSGQSKRFAVIGCSNGCCHLRPTIPGIFSIDEAIELWNTRHEPKCTIDKVYLYDEECLEGIMCDECGWSEIHDHSEPIPYTHCPKCKAKVVE